MAFTTLSDNKLADEIIGLIAQGVKLKKPTINSESALWEAHRIFETWMNSDAGS